MSSREPEEPPDDTAQAHVSPTPNQTGDSGASTGDSDEPGRWATIRLLALALLLTVAGSIPVFLFGALAVQIQADVGFGTSGIGAGVAMYFATSAILSPPSGRLVQRIGARRSMYFSGLLAVVVLMGVAVTARSLLAFQLWLGLSGLCNALAQTAANALLANRIPVRMQGLAFAAKQSAIPVSTLLGGLAVPVIALTVGWRWAFVAASALAVVAVALIPRKAPTGASRRSRVTGPVPYRPLLLVAGAGALGASAATTIGSFLVASAVAGGIGEASAGLLLAVASVLQLGVRMGAGVIADRRGHGFFEMAAMLMLIGAVGFVLLGSGTMVLFIAGAMIATAAGWGWQGVYNLAVVDHNRRITAVATGISQAGVYTGGLVGPLLFGAVVERASFATAWLIAAALGLSGSATLMFARRVLQRRSEV